MIKSRYTLHLHHAFKAGDHYDLRLAYLNNVYSFALPKCKLPDKDNVYLAILSHVDEKDLSILSFEGSIAKPNYGAGKIEILERGLFIPQEWTDVKKIFVVPHQYNDNQQYLEGEIIAF